MTIRLDEEVVRFFRSMGPDWQPRMNRVLSGWVHARLAGMIRGAETMDYMKRAADEGMDGRRPEFGDIQREYDAAFGPEVATEGGVPMAAERRMSELGRKALFEQMKARNGL